MIKSELIKRYDKDEGFSSLYEDNTFFSIKYVDIAKKSLVKVINNIPKYILLEKEENNKYIELITGIPVGVNNLEGKGKIEDIPVFFESEEDLVYINNDNSSDIVLNNYKNVNLDDFFDSVNNFYDNACKQLRICRLESNNLDLKNLETEKILKKMREFKNIKRKLDKDK